ncbi:MAG: Gldg family protein [Planctomycetaceae bacterium]|nr:Gldg family protein [Planctomycetaceae bacterium]
MTILVLIAALAPLAFALYRTVVSPAVRAVFLRNVKSYFSGVLGYLFIVVFVVAASLLAFNQQFFSNNLASLDQLSAAFPILLLFLVPAITMAAWSDERKLGTDELLFTLPARDLDILIGKYLAVVAVYTIALAFSITNLYVLEKMGNPDWGPIATTYLGYWLAGVALLAAGLLTSALTSSATVAFVLGAVVCAIPVFIDRMPRTFFGLFDLPRDFFAQLSVGEQLRDFTLGMVPLTGVLYFVSFASFMLYLNYVVIRKRHWAGSEQTQMGLQYAVRALSVAAALMGLNMLAQGGSARADLTNDDIYSLSPTTRKVIADMDQNRPVTIQAFVSPEVPREFVALRKQLTGLLRQYDEIGGAKIDVRLVDVEPFSERADEAKAFGIEPRQVMTERDGRQIREDVFMGVVFTSSYDEVVIPSLGPGSLLEYELTRSLGTVSKAERLTIGVLQTDANVIGGQSDWEIVRELRLQYEVESVSPASPIDEKKYDVLLAVMPSSLTQEEMDNFIAYVETGRPVLVFDDPYPMTLNSPGRISNAPRLPKPSPGGMMAQFNRQPPVPKADDGRLTSLMRLLQMTWTHDAIVWDDYNPHPEFGDLVPREYLFVRNRPENVASLNPKSEITSGLQEVLLAYAGEVRRRGNSELDYTPLIVTGPLSGIIPWEEFGEQSFNPMTFSPDFIVNRSPTYAVDTAVHAVAAHVKGDKKGEPNVVFVADIDIITDWFFQQRLQNTTLAFDNVTFVLNAVDALAGDEAYLELRKRRAKQRTLEEVEKQTAVFLAQLREREEKVDETLEKELEQRRKGFEEARKEIEQDTSLSGRARQERLEMALQNEQLRLEVFRQEQEKELEREKKKLKDQTQRQVRETEHRWWWRGVILPPLPAIILGLSVLLTRILRERREIDPDRSISR